MTEQEKKERKDKLVLLKLDGEIAEAANKLKKLIGDYGTPTQSTQASMLEWMKVLSPILLVVVTAVTAYFGVNKHAQIISEREQRLKEIELESSLRATLIKDYLALPTDTSRSRRDMLSFIAFTDPRPGVKDWAQQTRSELDGIISSQEQQVAPFYLPGKGPSVPAVHCKAVRSGTNQTFSIVNPLSSAYDETQEIKKCRAFAEQSCGSVKAKAEECSANVELIRIPSGRVNPVPMSTESAGLPPTMPQLPVPPVSSQSQPPATPRKILDDRQVVIDPQSLRERLGGAICHVWADGGFIEACRFGTESECQSSISVPAEYRSLHQCVSRPTELYCFGFVRRQVSGTNCYVLSKQCEESRSQFKPDDVVAMSRACEGLRL